MSSQGQKWTNKEMCNLVKLTSTCKDTQNRIQWSIIQQRISTRSINQLKRQFNNIKQRRPEMLLDDELHFDTQLNNDSLASLASISNNSMNFSKSFTIENSFHAKVIQEHDTIDERPLYENFDEILALLNSLQKTQ
ncbi:hypothetical protein SS50377_25109 [Spironucleus salmonicida]|uniref:Myb-like domain-containing protein n=1 Tax=Spironucleus salmonicida TaxID=348837 RepID=V6LK58_9EUKA|nr:hypothetical protein SS50377_25109 [Spironucleus salmonicida]|eukprot:EST44708.1 Hypothetical protein SS50377_15420 [Spironucleus salmonicida]